MENRTKKLPFRRYFSITRAGILEMAMFRSSRVLDFVGNMVYMIVVYFLWRAIYASTHTVSVNGMTFKQTLIYLTLAGAIFSTLNNYLVWKMGRDIQSGQISLFFTKPMDFFLREFFYSLGNVATQLVLTFIPTFLVVSILSGWSLPMGVNLLIFLPAIAMSLVISFSIDFMVGTVCLYSQSVWGINMMKEVIILLLSGATIPLAFFPEAFRNVLMFLPFQAIYNVPLMVLVSNTYTWIDYARALGVQAFWMVILVACARLFFRSSSRVITVNGG